MMSDEISRLALLYEISLSGDLTDDQYDELDQLERKYPDWLPADAQPISVKIVKKPDVFTREELEIIARSQRTSLRSMKFRWIIQRAGMFYVLGQTGEYLAPIGRQELAVSLPRDLGRVPTTSAAAPAEEGTLCWDKMAGERVINKTVDDLLHDYATVARNVETSMAIPYSYYDDETETFYERVCAMRPIKPVYHGEIDQWLTLLGGDQSEKLKDWVAMADRLDKPICAVYLHGGKDTGKSMFAMGLARLWSSGPTPMRSAFSDFNSLMASNPLILADEGLPRRVDSTLLREFVTTNEHSLRRKGIPESKLTGCYRVVITANNAELLAFDEENFSGEDVSAIAGRILYIRCNDEAATYLRKLGGRDYTTPWVSGDQIAEHAAWLSQNRAVKVGPRFLVQGDKIDRIHRAVASGGPVRSRIAEWICKAMIEKNWPVGPKAPERGIQFGGGRLYVNPSFVQKNWEEILGDNRVPSLKSVGQALRPMSVPDDLGRKEKRLSMEGRRVDFYHIDPEHVYEAAESSLIAPREFFAELINAPRAWLDQVHNEPETKTAKTESFGRGLFDVSVETDKK